MGVKELVKQVLTEKENRRYHRILAGKKVTYGGWLAEQELRWSIPDGAAEDGAEDQDFVLICAGEGKIASHAEKSFAMFFRNHPETMILYADEDVLTVGGIYGNPWFKPDWSPDLLDGCPYFGSLVAVRRDLWERTRELYEQKYPGQWEKLFGQTVEERPCRVTDIAAYEKWLRDCSAEGYRKGSRMVGHVPQILFHAADQKAQERFLEQPEYLRECRRRRMADFLETYGAGGDGCPLVSVVIPSRDQPQILEQCINSIKAAAAELPFEILVVDNGSNGENRARIEEMLRRAGESADGRGISVSYLYEPMEFNFSRMCNLGAEKAEGKLLLFLNDDVELTDGCIKEMAALAVRDYTGAVGMKLLYPQTVLIQHDGIVNLPVGPVHKLQFHEDDRSYYFGRNRFDCNCLAVTGACLMIGEQKFWEAGGFKEALRVAYNDVELGFRLWELGYANVVVNSCYAWHHESLSRGNDESPEKQERLAQERELLYQMHPDCREKDPYYPDGLNREGLDSRIVPAYVSCRNTPQTGEWKAFPYKLEEIRQDECLMVRVETSGPKRIQGYSVVLGDNNACYDKFLLLIPQDDTGDGIPLWMKLTGQYRQDLEENLPDQVNVALGGFSVSREGEKVPVGNYRIALLAVNRVTGLKLWNESGKSLIIRF